MTLSFTCTGLMDYAAPGSVSKNMDLSVSSASSQKSQTIENGVIPQLALLPCFTLVVK